jgi:hypothetical protein
MKFALKSQNVCTNRNRGTYHTVVNLEPLVLDVLHVAHIMTGKSSIHNIQMNNHSIQSVNGCLITGPAHERRQVKYFRKLNRLVKLSEFSRLRNI